MTEHYFYVPYQFEAEFSALGWVFDSLLGPPHCAYSSLWRWAGEGEPAIPERYRKEGE
jgi:hypothetical protein